jgi:hydrogenase maturation protein HypF
MEETDRMNGPSEAETTKEMTLRLRLIVRGAVQGVGFRPFIFRLAKELGLVGWVNNSPQGVLIEVESPRSRLESFLLRVEGEKPPRSSIQSLEAFWLDPIGYSGFEIRTSETGGAKTALVLPDIATCPECLAEIRDPGDRRYFYPFTNCTNCGPRFSIIESLPYDRANTSMQRFTMCAQCQAEYDDPRDRRFHAQPNACPACGPQVELWDAHGKASHARPTFETRMMLSAAADALRAGKILAVKGLGGFHLMVAAHNDDAVSRLRTLKHREEKPFALMFPSVQSVKTFCNVTPLEERLLRSPECPIVLLGRQDSGIGTPLPALSPSIAPHNPTLGAMLPYTPLHQLLLSLLNFPVVATSGNLRDEPICTDERDAVERLGGIADGFLVHNRPIVRHVDDSITRMMAGREMVLRRARGYAPLPISISASSGRFGSQKNDTMPPAQAVAGFPSSASVLAVGAHLKNAIALSVGTQVFVSQHIGDLETNKAYEAFQKVIGDLGTLYETHPSVIAVDAHPDYLSTKFASLRSVGPFRKVVTVQHHQAHVLACMADNELVPPVLGVSWDGTGYGLDGTLWGGEFFRITEPDCERIAHLRQFRLPGGDKAVREPRRTALGLLFEHFGEAAFQMGDLAPVRACPPAELATIQKMLVRGLNSPMTSSIGRLFDAVASLAVLRQFAHFEGQAAMELEFSLDEIDTQEAYSFALAPGVGPKPGLDSVQAEFSPSAAQPEPKANASPMLILDWVPLLDSLLSDVRQGVSTAVLSARFHNALIEAILSVALSAGLERVVLSGGCFQNRYLTERTVHKLKQAGLRPYWHQRVPPNDGGICLGQIIAALRQTV